MTLLSLDLGLKTGIHIEGDTHAVTHENRPKKSTKSVFWMLYSKLDELVINKKITTIAYEEAKFQQGMAISYYHGFAAIVSLIGQIYNINVVPIPVGTIKKLVTGKGNADKDEIMKTVTELGYTFDDNNSADAIAVTLAYRKLYT